MPHKDPEVRKAYKQAYYQAHKEEMKAQQKVYDASHAEKKKAVSRAWYAANKERARVRNKAFYDAHPELMRQRKKSYYDAHAEELRAYSRAYWAAHPEENRAYYEEHREEKIARMLAWARENPDLKRAKEKSRRATKYNAPVCDFTAAQWAEMQATYGHRCVYCGKRAKGHLTQDHITPLSKGGSHTASNIVPACRSCNSSKSTKAAPVLVQPLLFTVASSRPNRSSVCSPPNVPHP